MKLPNLSPLISAFFLHIFFGRYDRPTPDGWRGEQKGGEERRGNKQRTMAGEASKREGESEGGTSGEQ